MIKIHSVSLINHQLYKPEISIVELP